MTFGFKEIAAQIRELSSDKKTVLFNQRVVETALRDGRISREEYEKLVQLIARLYVVHHDQLVLDLAHHGDFWKGGSAVELEQRILQGRVVWSGNPEELKRALSDLHTSNIFSLEECDFLEYAILAKCAIGLADADRSLRRKLQTRDNILLYELYNFDKENPWNILLNSFWYGDMLLIELRDMLGKSSDANRFISAGRDVWDHGRRVALSVMNIQLARKGLAENARAALAWMFSGNLANTGTMVGRRMPEILEEMFRLKIFSEISLFELGGDHYPELFKPMDQDFYLWVCEHPEFTGEYIQHEGEGHQTVSKESRFTLDTCKRYCKKKVDYTLSSRVISHGSGMSYGGYSDRFCALELLGAFASLTKKGGYSIHYIEAGPYIEDPGFLSLAGLRKELGEGGVGLYVFRKVNNKTLSKKRFEEWFARL